MRGGGTLYGLLGFARRYLAAIALVGALAASALRIATVGAGPVPQGPPSGAVLYAGHVDLRWSRGARGGEIRLQVAADDPGFAAPTVDEVAEGTGRRLDRLEAGRTYYWRLVRDGAPGAALRFTIAADALGL